MAKKLWWMKWLQPFVKSRAVYEKGIETMMEQIKIPVVQGIEVGLGWGCSGKFFLERYPEARLVSFDNCDELEAMPKMQEAFGRRFVFIHPQWMGNDWEVVNKPYPGLHCEWLYIDGGHEYHEVKNDLAAYERYLRVGGVLAFDDYTVDPKSQYQYAGVKKAVDEFMAANKDRFSELVVMQGYETGPAYAIKVKE